MPVVGRLINDTSSNWLAEFADSITSQYGEDGIIRKIFEILPAVEQPWCVEFGAWDGREHSNTWDLVSNRGWRGVLIEGNAVRYEELCSTYHGNPDAICVRRLVRLEGPDSLDMILTAHSVPENFDLLCIDVDGLDYHIWKSLGAFTPRLVLIEFNPSIPNDVAFVQDADPSVNHGNSLLALIRLGEEKGWELIATTPTNAFFVQAQYFDLFDIGNNHINMIHDPSGYETKLFQLYDGTLVLEGHTRLIWHGGIEISQEAIQVLPPEQRVFADRVPSEPDG
jgi:hypothetical protein